MSKYTLTDDLIRDCENLILDNLDKLQTRRYPVRILPDGKIYPDEDLPFGEMNDGEKVLFLSHCLRVIPEFKEPSPQYIERCVEWREQSEKIQNINWAKDNKDEHVKMYIIDGELQNMPQTIWQATLFGGGTFPNTLEELCESYKNVMSK